MHTQTSAARSISGSASSAGNILLGVLFFFLFITPKIVIAQTVTFAAEAELRTVLSSDDNPFWFHRNTNFELGESSGVLTRAEVSAIYPVSENAVFLAAAEGMYRNDVPDEIQRGNLFVSFRNRWLKATVGSKRQEVRLNGLSSSNQNILWSGNARPVPGVVLEANAPIKITPHLGIDWGIGHYQLNDDRFVNDTRIHYKRLGIIAKINNRNHLQFRLQHFAQWAGTSPTFGELKSDFDGFVDVFLARRTSETGADDEIFNAVGNHLGSYFLQYVYSSGEYEFRAYHDHLFEDGSGTRLKNFPDGIWGVSLSSAEPKILQHILYEFVTTKDQSGDTGLSSRDNYFRNSVYINGWSYEGNILGLPFIVYDRSINIDQDNSPITGNRIAAHHLGAKGQVGRIHWEAKSSYVQNFGLYRAPIDPPQKFWFNYAKATLNTAEFGSFYAQLGIDISEQRSPNWGAGIGYSYKLQN